MGEVSSICAHEYIKGESAAILAHNAKVDNAISLKRACDLRCEMDEFYRLHPEEREEC